MTLPDDLALPEDHEARISVARRVAQWHLGDPEWADAILSAYFAPTVADTGDA